MRPFTARRSRAAEESISTSAEAAASRVSRCHIALTGISRWRAVIALAAGLLAGATCATLAVCAPMAAPQWQEVELSFEAKADAPNPYVATRAWVDFTDDDGRSVRRPMFWDGGHTFRVRFMSDRDHGTWRWRSTDPGADPGLDAQSGLLQAASPEPIASVPSTVHGLLEMSAGHRSVQFDDGTPFLMIADTAWALPWRATVDAVRTYAADRQAKGFNAALMMSVQPDQDARGPMSRSEPGGFDVAFDDLKNGHIKQLRPEYFQYLDRLIAVLYKHGIVPVFQPVFQGFGWKGLRTLGSTVAPAEYGRYCRYLVARYGARPAIWLVSADSDGLAPGVESCGQQIEAWDAYGQPTGIHYGPGNWPHAHQSESWLDFQWTQTGHNGVHLQGRVRPMQNVPPKKAVANGEPTYEGIGRPQNGAGWWQGEEAWLNFTSGGTMGVVYGAGGLWQWKLTPGEIGWPSWADSPGRSWVEALDQPGGRFVGWLGKALAGYDTRDLVSLPQSGPQVVGRVGELYIAYLPRGGPVTLADLTRKLPYRWFNPRTGEFGQGGQIEPVAPSLTAPDEAPWVLIVGEPET